jgi:MFS family permease
VNFHFFSNPCDFWILIEPGLIFPALRFSGKSLSPFLHRQNLRKMNQKIEQTISAIIGLSIAVYGLARFLVSVPTGQLADRPGRRWALVLGEAVSAVGNLLCSLCTTYEQFLLFRFVAGAGASMVLTSGQVSLADLSTPANRGRVMGVYQGVFLFAVGFGPLPGGVLAGHFGLSVPFFTFAAMRMVAGVVAFSRVPEVRQKRCPLHSNSLSNSSRRMLADRSPRVLRNPPSPHVPVAYTPMPSG